VLLSTQTYIFQKRLGDMDAIRVLCEAGFDALDFSMFELDYAEHPLYGGGYLAYAENLRRIASDSGAAFCQSHAPYTRGMVNGEGYDRVAFRRIVRSMEISSILGAKIIVIHPLYSDFPDCADMKKHNMDFYGRLLPYCKEYGVKVALENLYRRDADGNILPAVCANGAQFREYLDALDSRYFIACLDLGHCGIVGENAAEMVRALGHDRLKALHVHDNDGSQDSHTAPFFGKMDWPAIMAALAGIGYDGGFSLETDCFFLGLPDDLLLGAARFLRDIGRRLIRMLENGG
jgi:sugar phosphate isomerase/epimerase